MRITEHFLMAGVKEFPKEFVLTKYYDENIALNHPGMDPVVSRKVPAVYTREDDEEGIYYVNKEGKDCFFFKKTAFGWTANICEADKKNLDQPTDFKLAFYKVCDQYIEFSDPIRTK